MIDGAMQHIGTRSPHISPMVRLNLATEARPPAGEITPVACVAWESEDAADSALVEASFRGW